MSGIPSATERLERDRMERLGSRGERKSGSERTTGTYTLGSSRVKETTSRIKLSKEGEDGYGICCKAKEKTSRMKLISTSGECLSQCQ
jgi:hypothetical protein